MTPSKIPRGPEALIDASLGFKELAMGILLASSSGAAIMAHTFLDISLAILAPFVVLPSAAILVGAILIGRNEKTRLKTFSNQLYSGAIWGFLATIVYDVIRPILGSLMSFQYDPFKAMPIFGSLISGMPQDQTLAQVIGWGYHFWNGISFGMIFALLRPGGGIYWGLAWGLGLHGLMMITYPNFLQVRLDDLGFMISGIIGHAAWGVVLGIGIQRWGRR